VLQPHDHALGRRNQIRTPPGPSALRTRGDLLHDWDGTLADERDRHTGWGAHALAWDAASGVGGDLAVDQRHRVSRSASGGSRRTMPSWICFSYG
jgi:hypothetical protein